MSKHLKRRRPGPRKEARKRGPPIFCHVMICSGQPLIDMTYSPEERLWEVHIEADDVELAADLTADAEKMIRGMETPTEPFNQTLRPLKMR